MRLYVSYIITGREPGMTNGNRVSKTRSVPVSITRAITINEKGLPKTIAELAAIEQAIMEHVHPTIQNPLVAILFMAEYAE